MKIRSGFVSNSSSSSFIIAGFFVDKNKYGKKDEFLLKLYENDKNFPKRQEITRERGCFHVETKSSFCPECGKPMWVIISQDEDDYEEAVREFLNEKSYSDSGVIFLDEVAKKDTYFVGTMVCNTSSDDIYDTKKTSLQDINERIENIRKELSIDIFQPIKIISNSSC